MYATVVAMVMILSRAVYRCEAIDTRAGDFVVQSREGVGREGACRRS